MSRVKVSIVIVHYRNKNRLFGCLNSIKLQRPKNTCEVIVVDNDERKTIGPSLRRSFPWVQYVKSKGNVGYAAGNNLGAKYAKGKYLLILNPDTELLSKSIDKLVQFLEENKRTAIAAPNLVDKKGNVFPRLGSKKLTPLRGMVVLSFLNRLFPNNPVSKDYWMEDLNEEKLREVDVVPGSAFLIRRNVFNKLGGFDEIFFLFFEESDLCKKIKDAGYKVVIIPEAEVVHFWGASTPKTQRIKDIFSKSRFYYFKKHYGLISALTVEAFARLSKWHILLILITLLGAFLRFYRIEENLVFHGEVGFDYLAIKNVIENRQIPLIGPPTSHPWLSIGPLFYWMFALILPLAVFDPLVGAIFFAVVGVLAIYLIYVVMERTFGSKTALISSYLFSISPAWVTLTRDARFNSLAAFLFIPFYYFLVESVTKKGKDLFWVGFILGLMFNFFAVSPVLLLPVMVVLFLKRSDLKSRDIYKGLVGLVIPTIPFLLHNLLNRFEMLAKFIIWFPYRAAGFVGLYPKNNASLEMITANFTSFYNFFREAWFGENNTIAFILFISVLVFTVFKTKKLSFKTKKGVALGTLLMILVITYGAFFIHGAPPRHYYYVVFPIPIILTSLMLDGLWQRKLGFFLVTLILGVLTLQNFKYYFSDKWFYLPLDRVKVGELPVPYNLQIKVVEFIINDAKGEKFKLSRVGPFDYFSEDFSQNYKYLLWRLGNEPVDTAKIEYVIYEDTTKLPEDSEFEINWIANIAVVKKRI